MQEWRDLGMIDDKFQVEMLKLKDLTNELLYPQYQFLPVDTRYFKDLELRILEIFDDLDSALDGWLIHSENYQALNTILQKFSEKVDCIHIDPPYNTNSSGFYYVNNFSHSSWLSMMYDRSVLGLSLLNKDGVLACHIDEYELERLNLAFDQIGLINAGIMVWDRGQPVTGAYGLATQHEYVLWRSKANKKIRVEKANVDLICNKAKTLLSKYGGSIQQAIKEYREWLRNNHSLSDSERTFDSFDANGRVYRSDNMSATDNRVDEKFHIPLIHPVTGHPCPIPDFCWRFTPDTLQELQNKGEIIFGDDHTKMPRKKTYLDASESSQLSSMYRSGGRGKNQLDELGLAFPYAHNTDFSEYILRAALPDNGGIVIDFFGGSGTTAASVINLNRSREKPKKAKYLMVEMGNQFNEVILPRIKKVTFSNSWKSGKVNRGQGISQFVKYYDLEQYEDVLSRTRYKDSDLFDNPYEDPYHRYIFLRDLKMLDSIDIDREHNEVHFHPERLYPDIDLAGTLSQRRGKWIRRITAEYVEFQDGERMSLTDPDWQVIKPLVWWQ